MDKKFHSTLYRACDYLSILGLKLIPRNLMCHRKYAMTCQNRIGIGDDSRLILVHSGYGIFSGCVCETVHKPVDFPFQLWVPDLLINYIDSNQLGDCIDNLWFDMPTGLTFLQQLNPDKRNGPLFCINNDVTCPGVSNHLQFDCLSNDLFRITRQKI